MVALLAQMPARNDTALPATDSPSDQAHTSLDSEPKALLRFVNVAHMGRVKRRLPCTMAQVF
jgi:hypothetical protein